MSLVKIISQTTAGKWAGRRRKSSCQGRERLHWGWERTGKWVRCPFNQCLGRDEKKMNELFVHIRAGQGGRALKLLPPEAPAGWAISVAFLQSPVAPGMARGAQRGEHSPCRCLLRRFDWFSMQELVPGL